MTKPDRHRSLPSILELALVAAVVIAARVWYLSFTHVTYEDALISLRYARNLASGMGLVYNPGERVFGATTPLYVLLLAGLTSLHLSDPLLGAKLIAMAADVVTTLVWYRLIMRETGSRAAALAFVAAFGLSPFIVEITASGMETALVLCGLTLAFEAYYSRRGAALGLWLGLLLLLRLDTALFVAILLAARARQDRRLALRDLAMLVAVVAPWFVFSLIYYDSIIPNSIPAKLNAYNLHMHDMGRQFRFTVSHFTPYRSGARAGLFAAIYTPLFLCGAACALRRRRVMLPVLGFFLAQWAFLVLPRSVIFFWYLPPLLLPYYVLGGIGMAELLRWHATTRTRPALRQAFCATLVGGLILHTGHWLATAADRRWDIQTYEETIRKPIGQWLARNTPPNAVVSAEPIGYIGYYSHRRILDEVGLVSPKVIPYTRRGAGWFGAVVKAYHPDYIVERPFFLMQNKTLITNVPMFASPADRDWFWANYHPVREFACSGSIGYQRTYTFVILKRRGAGDARNETAESSKAPHRSAPRAAAG